MWHTPACWYFSNFSWKSSVYVGFHAEKNRNHMIAEIWAVSCDLFANLARDLPREPVAPAEHLLDLLALLLLMALKSLIIHRGGRHFAIVSLREEIRLRMNFSRELSRARIQPLVFFNNSGLFFSFHLKTRHSVYDRRAES